MKNIIILPFALLLVFMSSCSDYLEYKDKDKIIPRELAHFQELIFGEIIYVDRGSSGEMMRYLTYMSDEMQDLFTTYTYGSDKRLRYQSYYTWAIEPQLSKEGIERNDDAWKWLYHKVLMCNIIEKEVNALADDAKHTKLRLLGEVNFMRALSYYYLVNLYGEPYKDAQQAKTAKGVPFNYNTGVAIEKYPRASLEANYAQMEKDLLAAIDYFDRGEKLQTKFRPNANVAKLFLSRVYLYSKRYDDVIRVTTDLIDNSGLRIVDLATMKVTAEDKVILFNINNPSIMFTWDKIGTIDFKYDGSWNNAFFLVSKELRDLYAETTDTRATAFLGRTKVAGDIDMFYPVKNMGTRTDIRDRSYRLEEVYLNRAEAYIEKGAATYQLGLDDVNTIRRERIETNPVVTAASQTEARELYRRERRMELSFEDHRWFDIRRWEVPITHKINLNATGDNFETYVLPAGSPNYTLPLPFDVTRVDPSTENIERVNTKVN